MQDFDRDIARGDALRGALDEGFDVFAEAVALGSIEQLWIPWHGEVGFQFRLVDLCDGAHAEGLLVEFFEDVFEGTVVEGAADDALCGLEGVGGGVGVELGHYFAHLSWEDVGAGGSPLT